MTSLDDGLSLPVSQTVLSQPADELIGPDRGLDLQCLAGLSLFMLDHCRRSLLT